MAVFKCKMCGGTIEFNPGDTVGVCDSCGTKQTLPRLDDDRRANLYDRANHFRRNNEFDKAMGIYETILNEDPTDAEAYWSLVLCKYGVEYVEDPATHRRVPTVNRAQYTSVLADEDYKAAVKNADAAQKALYEAEAKAIDEIQKGILEISQKEEPFDVFICYKETDAQGRRTVDSVRATELYHELTKEGFKVFFARITLEDKLGTAYEPYIFAALNSAKVMVVLGTKPEHFNAVWVKNEWSRYLALIRAGAQKTLIPAYQDMDPYDLPEEFSHLQAQDMSKLGFMQDLIRGVKKLTAADEPKPAVKETVVVSQPAAASSAAPLLERAFMFLEDGKWAEADEYCEKVLDLEPKNARAYLGKLMAELRVRTEADLKNAAEPFDGSDNAVKAARFDPAIAEKIKADNAFIRERNEIACKERVYQKGLQIMNTEYIFKADYKEAAQFFERIEGYKDADALAKTCLEKAEIARQEAIYQNGLRKMNAAKTEADYKEAARVFAEIKGFRDADDQVLVCLRSAKNVHNDLIYSEALTLMNESYDYETASKEKAIRLFESIIDWKDSRTKIDECNQKIEAIRIAEEKAEEERKRKAEEERLAAEKRNKLIKKTAIIGSPILAVFIVFLIVLNAVIIPASRYKIAVALYDAGKYDEAITAFKAMDGYKDSAEQISKCETALKDHQYDTAIALIDKGDYINAYEKLIEMKGYKDSTERAKAIFGEYKAEKNKNAAVGDIVYFGSYEQDNNTSNGKEDVEWFVLAKEENKTLLISKYALDCKPYNTKYTSVTWETCSLRKWLNIDFINSAFSAEEQKRIQTTTVTADANPNYSTSPDNNTTDKVFLLSIAEANKYFTTDEARECAPTDYAIAQGVRTSDSYSVGDKATGKWWLRSPGYFSDFAALVYYYGSVGDDGNGVGNDDVGVRPVLWISL